MNYETILATILGILLGGVSGYSLGRYQSKLLEKIRMLQEQANQPIVEPEKPIVAGGAYQPPKISSSSDDNKRAGLVETKTPERLDWENKVELSKLEHSA